MRVLFVIPNIISFRDFLGRLAARMNADGDEVHLACNSDMLWGNDPAAPDPEGVRRHCIEFPRGMNPLQHFKAARQLRSLVASIRPDLIHAHFSAAIFTAALARTRDWPWSIATFHGLSFPARSGVVGGIIRFAETFSARRFDEVCVLTDDDTAALREAVPGVRVGTLPSCGLGCDLAEFSPATASAREARRTALGFGAEHCVFVFVGRFVAFKGFDATVRAFLRLAAHHPHVRLLLVGMRDPLHPDGLSATEKQALAACPQVVDAGFQKDVESYLAAADVMVFPSAREGVPVCLMEALAMGIPAITRDSRGCRDVVRDGVDGFVLGECGEVPLSRAMQRLADDPALRARLSAQALAGRDRFSRGHFIAAQRAVYAARAAAAGRVKVGHVTTIVHSLEFLLLNQLRALSEAGYEACGIASPGPEERALASRGIAFLAVPISRNFTPLADLLSLWRLVRVMRRDRFAIIHTHTPKAGLLGQLAARLAGVPVVVNTIHGFYFHERMRPLARRFYILMEKIAARCSTHIFSQNAEDLATAGREGIARPPQVELLGNGIDLTRFDPRAITAEDERACRRAVALPEDAPVVGFVGRLAAERKGFRDFLAAAKVIAGRLPSVRFVIVGEADHGKPDAVEPAVAAEYGIADRCLFLGQRANAELPPLYKIMSVLVLPSVFEGIPRMVMEAAAMGVPAVVTDVKGNREVVTHDSNGLLVPFGDVPALAAAILRVLTEPETARRMSAAALEMAAGHFDERLVFAKVQDTYARLLRGKNLPLPTPRAALTDSPAR
jgi:glycosyltransferase involved in cell wall biosynthesis